MNIFKKAVCAFLTLALLVPFGSGLAVESDTEKVTLIVQMESGSTVEQISEVTKKGITLTEECEQKITNSILREQRAVQRDIVLTVDTDIHFGYNYTAALNGFSMEADAADVPYIKALDGVKNVYISRSHTITDPVANSERAIHSDYGALMANVTSLHEQGYRGEGTVIAIIDTEFDTNHEFLRGDVTNPRLSKDDIAEAISDMELSANVTVNRAWKSDKIPFAYNYTYENADTFNNDPGIVHGTHVAGIAAGKNGKLPNGDTFDGTAPEAQILCMAVPTLSDDNCLAAIDDAIKLGADVLNLSWGADYVEPGLYDDAFSNALLSGMFIANAAGNSRIGYNDSLPPTPIFDYGAMGNPADSSLATTVASAHNPKEWLDMLHIFADGTEIEKLSEQNYDYRFISIFDGKDDIEYVMCGTNYGYEGDLTDKIAVFDYSDSYSDEQIFNTARKNGASGVIVIVPDDLFEDFMVLYDYMLTTPTLTVPASMRSILESGSRITARMMPTLVGRDTLTPILSYFTAWGVFSSLKLDPNITAMGGLVYSSIPDDEYDTYSGTSMATPQVSGSAALLKEYLSKNEPSFNELTPHEQVLEIENRMMSTAETLYCYDDNGDPIPESPRHQGAGLLNVEAAAKTPAVLTGTDGRTKIELGDKLTDDISFAFTVKNLSDSPATYIDISMCIFTNDANWGAVMEFGKKLNTVSVSLPQSVTAPAGESVNVDVSFMLDADQVSEIENVFVNGFFVDGFVFLKSDSDAPALAIPFMGFHGDWNGGPLIDTEGWLRGGVKLASGISYHTYDMDYNGHLIDGCTELGRNRIIDEHAWDLPYEYDTNPDDYHSERFAGISPNGDDYFDYVCMSFVPLRQLDRAVYELKDADGNVLLRHENDGTESRINRFTASAHMFSLEELEAVGADKDGSYSVTLTVWRNGTDQPQSVTKHFYVDTDKPVVNSFEMMEDGRIYIEISDNRHLMGVEVTDAVTDEWLTARPLDAPDECGTVIDVSNWLDRQLKVSVYDYADNKTSVFYGIGAGDINGDGEIDNVDLVLLARYLVHLENFYVDLIRKSDFNTDGLVDNMDLVELARYLVRK